MNSIKKNIIYNIAYQMLIVFVPFITSPYLSRTLGAEKIGVYSFTYSIVFYFMMLSMLGINNYGNRSIAKVRDNTEKLSKEFLSIYAIQCFMSIIMMILYIVYIIFSAEKYNIIAIIQGVYILSTALDITWFFYGLEDFKIVIIRNTIVKIVTLLSILTFVKSPNDLWIYTLIMGGSTLLGQIITWPLVFKKIILIKIKFNDIIPHIKPIFILFIPVLAISVFSYMDKIMLGSISDMKETGFYENTDKIISIPKSIISALGTVMLPRTAHMIAIGKEKKSKEYIENTMFYVLWISLAFTFGLAGIANVFAPVFWGESFKECGILITYMAPALIFSVFGNVIRTQFLIPRSMDKDYSWSLVWGAIINFIVNICLIPKFGARGAVIGTLCAEFSLCFYQTYVVRQYLNIEEYLRTGIVFLPISLLMFIVLKFIGKVLSPNITTLAIQITIGAFIYLTFSIIYIYKSNNKVVIRIREMITKKDRV